MRIKDLYWDVTLNRLATGIANKVMYWDGVSNVYTYRNGVVMKHYITEPGKVWAEGPIQHERFKITELGMIRCKRLEEHSNAV